MQTPLTADERKQINRLIKPYGRKKWFCASAGIPEEALRRIRDKGEADDRNVQKVREFLQNQQAVAV